MEIARATINRPLSAIKSRMLSMRHRRPHGVAGVLVSSDSHISIQMIDAVRSPLVRRIVRVISCLTVAAVGVALTAEAWELTQTQAVLKSPAMRMPMSWLYAISMIGFVSTVVRATLAALKFAVVGVPEPDHGELWQSSRCGALSCSRCSSPGCW